jgi:hypothetical protein
MVINKSKGRGGTHAGVQLGGELQACFFVNQIQAAHAPRAQAGTHAVAMRRQARRSDILYLNWRSRAASGCGQKATAMKRRMAFKLTLCKSRRNRHRTFNST